MSTACHIHIDLFRNKQQRLPVFEDCFLDSFFCDVFVDLESYSVSIYITFFDIFDIKYSLVYYINFDISTTLYSIY